MGTSDEQRNGTDRDVPPDRGNQRRIKELEEQIAELKRRWPAHSTPPAMLQRLDELEEELEDEKNKARRLDDGLPGAMGDDDAH